MKYTKENLTEFINTKIIYCLIKNHFSKHPENELINYKKSYNWGFDEFTFTRIAFLGTHLEFGISIARRYSILEEIWQDYRELINLTNSNLSDTLYIFHGNASEEIKQKSYYDGSLRFEISEKGLAEIPEAIEFVMNKIFEKLDIFLDIKNVDKLINSELDPLPENNEIFWRDGGFMFKRMILAKLTGNNIYQEVCDFYKSRFIKILEISKTPGKEYFSNYPIVFEKVYEKLKNIQPLENTVLSDKVV